MSPAFELFILGITVSSGHCLLFCSPLILPYIAATKKGWGDGILAMLSFSLGHLVMSILWGGLAGLLGNLLVLRVHQFDHIVFLGGGLFISLVGILIILSEERLHPFCQVLKRGTIETRFKGPLILGLILGSLPCLSLSGVLACITLKAQGFYHGLFLGLAFGVGRVFSPLIFLGVLASGLPQGLIKSPKAKTLFGKACGLILLLVGVHLILSRW